MPKQPDLAVERAAVDALVPYARNTRKHSPGQIAQLRASLREFGFVNPILIDRDGGLIAGHARLEAARLEGMTEVPVIRLGHLTDAQRRAYVIADNRLAELATWDIDLLRVEVDEVLAAGLSLEPLGFDEASLAALIGTTTVAGLTDPDDAPEPPEAPASVLGDVWVMGRHRIVCGDSTDPLVVEKALAGVKPHLMVTDPPYGVNYDPKRRDAGLKDGMRRALGKVQNDDNADWSGAWALFPGHIAYVWHAMKTASVVEAGLTTAGFELRSQIVWAKARHTLSPKNCNPLTAGYNPQHECCFYMLKAGGPPSWRGDRSQSTLWSIDHQKSDTGHGTQKPVECMRRPIENSSSPGQAVYEPFSGSGTTIIAAEMTGRACHAIELNPAYVDVAVRRWQDFTGQEATLEADGRTFNEVSAARLAKPKRAKSA